MDVYNRTHSEADRQEPSPLDPLIRRGYISTEDYDMLMGKWTPISREVHFGLCHRSAFRRFLGRTGSTKPLCLQFPLLVLAAWFTGRSSTGSRRKGPPGLL